MKAAVIRDFKAGPRYETDFPAPKADAKDDEGVSIEVLAAALSPRARSGASGQHYTSNGVLPLVPGVDGVGRLGDGRRVYFVAHDDAFGPMAERTLADARMMVPLPEAASAAEVAALMLPAMSSWVALTRRVAPAPGQRVLVLGATGTSGQLAVQVAKHLGAGHVVAAGRDAAALERTRSRGADAVVQLTGDGKADGQAVAAAASEVDVVLDYLWGAVTSTVLPAMCRARQAEGRALHWVLIGSAAGDEIALSSVLLRKRNLHVLGSGQGAVSTRDMFGAAPDIMRAYAAGKLAVDARAVPLAEVDTWWSAKVGSGERIVFVP
ncbi:MAG TPA: zinc-binding alcohol dehydrogenase family protein [Polyangia bacterium]|jgi:NADPH:quinone reductase-like Zn-dependent oxidoreductase|nr:zinc-binding alcohol dehydrogenase family protein [Polyangia bacterium]